MADRIATRQAYGEVLIELGKEYEDLVVMDADLSGSTKTSGFAGEFPDRFFNMGIAEQNLYAQAAGLALSGKTVCASTFAMFATGRAYEIVRNSIGYTGANVKICATHAGITVGEDGASHQTFEDISLMRNIPKMTVISPSDAVAAKKLIRQAVEMKGPCYIRLGRAAVPVFYGEDDEIILGKGNQVREGKDLTIIATGIMVSASVEASEILKKEGIDARIIDIHTIKPIDEEIILKAARETGRIVTAEEHSVIGGLGDAVAQIIVREHPVPMEMVGQKDVFGESGKPDELLEKYGMTSSDIAFAARRLIKR